MTDELLAPKGFVWVCMACGKISAHRAYGPGGWDVSCFINSELYPLDVLQFDKNNERVIGILYPKEPEIM